MQTGFSIHIGVSQWHCTLITLWRSQWWPRVLTRRRSSKFGNLSLNGSAQTPQISPLPADDEREEDWHAIGGSFPTIRCFAISGRARQHITRGGKEIRIR